MSEAASGGNEIACNILHVVESAESTTQGANDTECGALDLAKLTAEQQRMVDWFEKLVEGRCGTVSPLGVR